MSEAINRAIEEAQIELGAMMQRVNTLKKAINQLRAVNNESPLYPEDDTPANTVTASLKADEYYGKGLAAAVKDLLRRKGTACNAKEIYAGLQEGGFDFPETWGENKFKYLAISLSKSREDYCPVPRGKEKFYGLWEFYPEKPRVQEKKKKSTDKKHVPVYSEETSLSLGTTGTEENLQETNTPLTDATVKSIT